MEVIEGQKEGHKSFSMLAIIIVIEEVKAAYTTPPGMKVKPTHATPTKNPPPSSTMAARPPGQTITESDGTVCFLPDGSTDPDA